MQVPVVVPLKVSVETFADVDTTEIKEELDPDEPNRFPELS
jgi:hypothetical protein